LPKGVIVLDIDRSDPTNTKILCHCKSHGVFTTTKGSLKTGKYVCNECASFERGYAAKKLAQLSRNNELGSSCHIILLKVRVFDIYSLKLGVTTRTVDNRYGNAVVEIYHDEILPERISYSVEKKMLKKFIDNRDRRIRAAGLISKNRWKGDTELFQLSDKDDILFALKREITKQKQNFDLLF
jgi:hypothetical protein